MQGRTAVHAAAENGGEAALTAALQRHPEHLNARTHERRVSDITPLHLAAAAGHEGSVKILLNGGADIDAVDSSGRTPLCYAIDSGELSCVNTLLGAGASMAAPALHCAARHQTADVLRLLLDKGADIEAKNWWGGTALMCAAGSNSAACVQLLLSKGASVHAVTVNGKTALHCADPSCLPALLAAGSNREAVDSKGMTPLLVAAQRLNLASLRALLKRRANTEAADRSGRTALMLAAGAGDLWCINSKQESLQCVQLLLWRDANVAAIDKKDWTALHWAAKRGCIGTIKALAAKGAALAARNKEGHTARQVAAQARQVRAAQRLQQLEVERAEAEAEAAAELARAAAVEGAEAAAAAGAAGAAAAEAVATGEAAAAAAAGPGPAALPAPAAELDLLVGRHIRVPREDKDGARWVPGTVLEALPDGKHKVRLEGVEPDERVQRMHLATERYQLLGADGWRLVQPQYDCNRRAPPGEGQQGTAVPSLTAPSVRASVRQGHRPAGAPAVQQPTGSRSSGGRTESVAAAVSAAGVSEALAAAPVEQAAGPARRDSRRQSTELQQQQPERPPAKKQRAAAGAQDGGEAAELEGLVRQFFTGSRPQDNPLETRRGVYRRVPTTAAAEAPPARLIPWQPRWGPQAGFTKGAERALWALVQRHQAGDEEASRQLLTHLRLLADWLVDGALEQKQLPEALLRLGRPAGWQPPPVPSTLGVESVPPEPAEGSEALGGGVSMRVLVHRAADREDLATMAAAMAAVKQEQQQG